MRLARMLRLYVATTEGLTQKQVATEAGVNESTLSRFLSGEQMPDGRAFASLVTWCFGEHKGRTFEFSGGKAVRCDESEGLAGPR